MFAVDVDYVVHFVPPMVDYGHGIRLTRTIELPFPPCEDVSVFSKEWEGMEDPMGYRLKEITWDIDSGRFLADTEMSMTGTPIAMIPHEIRRLVDHGWQFGSYASRYKTERKRGRKRAKLPSLEIGDWDEDDAEAWNANPKGRPKEFKLVLHGVVATMAELHNNCSVAYAMLKTGGYVDVPERKMPSELSPLERRFSEATREYESLTSDKQWDWAERVQRRYPRLSDVVEAMR